MTLKWDNSLQCGHEFSFEALYQYVRYEAETWHPPPPNKFINGRYPMSITSGNFRVSVRESIVYNRANLHMIGTIQAETKATNLLIGTNHVIFPLSRFSKWITSGATTKNLPIQSAVARRIWIGDLFFMVQSFPEIMGYFSNIDGEKIHVSWLQNASFRKPVFSENRSHYLLR